MKAALGLLGVVFVVTSLISLIFMVAESQRQIINGDIGGSSLADDYTRVLSTKGEPLRIIVESDAPGNLSIFFDGERISGNALVGSGKIGVHKLEITSDSFVTFRLFVRNAGLGYVPMALCGVYTALGILFIGLSFVSRRSG